MNLLKNKLASRLMLLALLLVGAKTMSAESKLYIDPVAFDDYKVREIPVIFEHGGDMGAIQFDIILSKSLEFVDGGTDNPAIRRNADFLADGQKFGNRIYPTDANGRTAARVTIRTERKQAFPANKGTVAYLPKLSPQRLSTFHRFQKFPWVSPEVTSLSIPPEKRG